MVLCLTAILGAGCTPAMKMIYGIRSPKVENHQSLTDYLRRKGLRTDNIYTVDADSYARMLELIDAGIPDVMVFDREGRFLPYGEDSACNAGAFEFLRTLDRTRQYTSKEAPRLHEIATLLRDMHGRPVNLPEGSDFYVVIFWARWAGRLNKDHVKVWEESALRNPAADVAVLKVNMDMQQYWEESKTR